MSAVHNSAKAVLYHTAAVVDGDFASASATNLGILGSGSNIPDPEAINEDFMGGRAAVGGSIDLLFRILGTGGADVATINVQADLNPPPPGFVFVVNKSLTRYVQYEVTFQEAIEQGAGTDPKRVAWLLRAYGVGDKIDDFMKVFLASPVILS